MRNIDRIPTCFFDMITEHYWRSVHSCTIQKSCKYHKITNLAYRSVSGIVRL